MSNIWRLRVVSELQQSIESGAKTIELRIQTEKNRWLIQQMLEYQAGDQLHFEFVQGKDVVGTILTRVTAPTCVKLLGELDESEVRQIVGLLGIGRRELMALMSNLYHQEIDDSTTGYLAFFEKLS